MSVREIVCGGGGSEGTLGNATGVEADWLRFYWNLHNWINLDDGFRSILDPAFSASDATAEARAQDIMLALHAGVILNETDGGAFASDAYYNFAVDALCNSNSQLVEFIEKLNVDIDAVRAVFFNFAEDYGVWTGANFSPQC